jgi:hypothetical protein
VSESRDRIERFVKRWQPFGSLDLGLDMGAELRDLIASECKAARADAIAQAVKPGAARMAMMRRMNEEEDKR